MKTPHYVPHRLMLNKCIQIYNTLKFSKAQVGYLKGQKSITKKEEIKTTPSISQTINPISPGGKAYAEGKTNITFKQIIDIITYDLEHSYTTIGGKVYLVHPS